MFIPLNKDYNVMFCTKKYVNEDGSQVNETGVLPDVSVKLDMDAFVLGKDIQLERAIEILNERINR